jgi:hypothetical protein
MWHCVDIVLTDVSEECIPSIFRVEDKKKQTGLLHLLMLVHLGFLLAFYPEDGGDTFLRNVG